MSLTNYVNVNLNVSEPHNVNIDVSELTPGTQLNDSSSVSEPHTHSI